MSNLGSEAISDEQLNKTFGENNTITDTHLLKQDADKLDNLADLNWKVEIAGSVMLALLTPIVVGVIFSSPSIYLVLSTLGLTTSLLYSAYRLYDSTQADSTDDLTLLSKLNRQIEKRTKEVKMLTTLVYWQLIPIYLMVVLFSYAFSRELVGHDKPGDALLLWWIGGFVYIVFLAYHNRKVANSLYIPVLKKLQAWKRQIE